MKWNLTKALNARVLMLTGDEHVFRNRALKEILTFLGDDDFDREVIDADSQEPLNWVTSVSTAPFLSERRSVFVRHLLRSDADDCAKDLLGKVPDFGRLVLVADEESGDDNKQRRMESNRKAWEKKVEASGGEVVSFAVDSKGFPNLLREEAKLLDKTLSIQAAKLLEEMTGAKLGIATSELEKLAQYVGDRQEIRDEDVRQVVTPSREWNVFKLLDAILASRAEDALRQLRILIISPTKAEEAAYRNIFPALIKQLRLLWQARLCLDFGSDPANPSQQVLAMLPSKPNIVSESDWQRTKMVGAARHLTLDQIAAGFSALSRAEERLKGLRSSFSSVDTLEALVTELSMAFSKTARAA